MQMVCILFWSAIEHKHHPYMLLKLRMEIVLQTSFCIFIAGTHTPLFHSSLCMAKETKSLLLLNGKFMFCIATLAL